MQMDAGLDTGADAAAPRRSTIGADDTAATLARRAWPRSAAQLIVEALRRACRGGRCGARRSPSDGVTYAAKIAKAEATIDWRAAGGGDRAPPARLRSVARARRSVARRRDDQAAGAASVVPGRRRRRARSSPSTAARSRVACGEGALALTELQRPGGRRMAGRGVPARLDAAVGAASTPAPTGATAGRLNFGAPAASIAVRRARVDLRTTTHVQSAENRRPDGGDHRPVHGDRRAASAAGRG